MQVMLEGRGLWEAIESGTTVRTDDRLALEAILHGVPPEIMATLASKGTAKDAWASLNTMRLGVSRVHDDMADTLNKQLSARFFF
jgi:hypothetical protein